VKGIYYAPVKVIHGLFVERFPKYRLTYQSFSSFKPNFLEHGKIQECMVIYCFIYFILFILSYFFLIYLLFSIIFRFNLYLLCNADFEVVSTFLPLLIDFVGFCSECKKGFIFYRILFCLFQLAMVELKQRIQIDESFLLRAINQARLHLQFELCTHYMRCQHKLSIENYMDDITRVLFFELILKLLSLHFSSQFANQCFGIEVLSTFIGSPLFCSHS
jgi:hypothetical protein